MGVISGCSSFDEAIKRVYGESVAVVEKRRVSGGDINDAYMLRLSDGQRAFVKENSKDNLGFFEAEVQGLEAIATTGTIGVPMAYAYGTDGGRSFLLMESLESGHMPKDFWERFGHALADMHRADTTALFSDMHRGDATALFPEKKFGFARDNYIGAGYQKNTGKDSWIEFFRDCRILPQLERARKALLPEDVRRIEHLMEHLDEYLVEPEHPSLLHGDLWSGNFLVGPDGQAWLIDPAAYVGCAEADIAMTELFGGFSGAFYAAYRESGSDLLKPGYEDRRDIYNLYHMLNHLNLFGSSYLYAVERIIARF